MTTDLALEYLKRRAVELCFGDNYILRVRHFTLQPHEWRRIDAQNQLFILIEPYCDLRIESSSAVFDISEDNINELSYEHSGEILLINHSMFLNHARFIQVIPNNCIPCR